MHDNGAPPAPGDRALRFARVEAFIMNAGRRQHINARGHEQRCGYAVERDGRGLQTLVFLDERVEFLPPRTDLISLLIEKGRRQIFIFR